MGFVQPGDLDSYVSRIGRQLAAASERPDLPWEFRVVDDPMPNAFALPGGFIYVTRGLLNLLTSEAQLASVLGHEIAHVTARHSVNQISQRQLARAGLGLGGIFFPSVQELSPLISSGLGLLFLKHSRDDEREADEVGFRYVQHLGYAVSQFDDVFAALQRAGDDERSALPGWLSTHPMPAERIETVRAMAAKAPASATARIEREDYLGHLDGLVFGKNPRHGFFRENTFYHPELRFQLTFPRGWRTQNLTQAVVGTAPQGTAAIELTIAPGESAEQALRRFADQSGMDVGRPLVEHFGGLPGIQAEFGARTQQGAVRGVVALIEQRGRVYQLLAYSGAGYYSAAAAALTAAIDSFRPVTDPSILSVEPNRIGIVRLPRTQTLAEFSDRFPSAVPLEQLAIINHLPGPSASVQAGTLMKRVVS